MNTARVLISGVFFAAAAVFFSSPVHADSLSIPETFVHEGLTFEQPLQVSNSPSNIGITISFGSTNELQVKQTSQKPVAMEKIISPKPKSIILGIAVTVTPTLTPTPIPIVPTATLTPLPPTPTPTIVSAPVVLSNGGLDAEKLFNMSNEFRASRGLPPFQKDERSCALAASRAPEVAGEVASGNLHAGLHARNLDYWNTENIISMRSEESAFNWWVNHQIHHDAIVGNFTYSCVACHGNSCAQEFTNYQPK